MRKTIKYAVLFLAAAILIQSVAFAYSSEEWDSKVGEVIGLGIIGPDDEGLYRLDEAMTRGDFALSIKALLRLDSLSVGGNASGFSDVSPSDPYYSAVYLLGQFGYVNGFGDGTFRPDETITMPEATKILMDVLGYRQLCIENGGYPEGYMINATQVRLHVGVGSGTPFTKRMGAQLIYNALDIPLMTKSIDAQGTVYYRRDDDVTLRNLFENNANDSILKGRGIVTSNYTTWLSSPIRAIKEDQVEIDGVVYYVGNTLAADYLGMEIEYYVSVTDVSATNTLVYAKPTVQNTVVQIEAADFSEISGNTIHYQDASKKDKTCKVDSEAILVKNAAKVSAYTLDEITVLNGTMTLIDNNGDGSYDIISIEDYVSLVVRSVNISASTVYFDHGMTFDGAKNLKVDLEQQGEQYILKDKEGKNITLEDIAEGDVLSISASDDKERYKIVACSDVAEGIITEISTDGIKIGDGEYQFEEGKKEAGIEVSSTVKALLNYRGQIAYITTSDYSENYGFVIGSEEGTFGELSVRLLLPGTLAEDYIIDDTDADNIKSTPILRAGNSGIEVYSMAARVQIDGTYYSNPSEILALLNIENNKLVNYRLSSEGKIISIKFPERIGERDSRTFDAYEKVFGGVESGGFAINDTSKVICVPPVGSATPSDDDYMAKIDMNAGTTNIIGYDIDTTTSIARIVVLRVNLVAGVSGTITDKLSVVERISKVADEDGNVITRVRFWSEGKRFNYDVSKFLSDDARARIDKLQEGSVFYYSRDTDYNLADVNIIFDIYNSGGIGAKPGNAVYGYVSDIQYRYLSSPASRFVDRVTLVTTYTGLSRTVDLNVRNAPILYLFDMDTRQVSVITIDDIVTSPYEVYADKMFYDVINSSIKAVVLVRE